MTTPPPQGPNPYAQQPTAPMGQQPGQPGVPQQPYPPQQPYAPQQPYTPFPQQGAPVPPAPVPAKRGKKGLRIIGAIVVFVIVALVKFGAGFGLSWFLNRDDAETTSVGSCMHNDGTYSKPDLKEVDCSSGDSQYKVVQKFDSSDENKCKAVTEATIYYVQSGGGHDVVLCLKETN